MLNDLDGRSNNRLGEVVLHVLLEVEVGELISLAELEELGKLGIRVNLAAILVVLELVATDVAVNLLADSGSRKKGSLLLSEESSKLIGDEGRLNKARRGAVSRSALLLLGSLLGGLKLLGNRLLKSLELGLEGGSKSGKLGNLVGILRKLGGNVGLNHLSLNRSNGRNSLNGGLKDNSLNGLSLLSLRSNRCGGSGGLIGGSLSSSNHRVIIYYYRQSFLSILTQIYLLKLLLNRS